jgi:hypothetical protein
MTVFRFGSAVMAKRDAALKRGDLCHHGSNSYPVYVVICRHGGKAWVRDVSSGVEGLVDVERCLKMQPDDARRLDIDLRRVLALAGPAANLAPD